MLRQFRSLLEMIRFSHTLFALPFALLSALMAWQLPPRPVFRFRDLLGIVLSMVFARSAAMAFNRIADRDVDAINPRTRMRHIPTGMLKVRAVVLFTVANSLALVAATLLFWPNRWPLILSLPVLAFLFSYSFAKRWTSLAHFWLGAALMLAPVAAWIALRGELAWPPVILGVAVLLWVSGFDIIYACQDYEFDVRAGLHSLPAKLGVARSLRLAALCHLGMLVMLAVLPWAYPRFGWIYAAGIAAVGGLLVVEHWLVRPDDLARVNAAFFNVNIVISVGLLFIGAADLLI